MPQAVELLNQLPDLASKLPADQAASFTAARQFLTPAHIPAITNIVNNNIPPMSLSSSFNVNGKFSLDHAVDSLLQPALRAQLKQAGTANVAALIKDQSPFYSQRNLDALIRFADTVDSGNPNPNSRLIMKALAKVASGTSMHDAFKGFNGAQVAAFFSVKQNRDAFQTLIDPQTGIVGSTPAMQQEIALFRKDFNRGPGVGIGAILSDAKAAQFLLDHDDGKGPGNETVANGFYDAQRLDERQCAQQWRKPRDPDRTWQGARQC